ncbi:response regulator [Azospirillum sp. sgz302134]
MRILLVEDEVLIAMEQTFYLESAGHEVHGPASTAEKAIALAQEVKPELALVDIHLAQGSSGIDAARQMTAQGIACLFVTSYREEVEPSREYGIGCLPKPFSQASLVAAVEAVRAILDGKAPGPMPDTMELFS